MVWCGLCQRQFASLQSLDQHLLKSPLHNYCFKCDQDFTSPNALESHYANSQYHAYCHGCGNIYDDDDDLRDHIEQDHWDQYCESCSEFFKNNYGLREHYRQSSAHVFCAGCNQHYNYEEELEEHLEMEHGHDHCRACDWFFKNEVGLKDHFRQSPAHHYCAPCAKHFGSDNSLRNHLRSSIHLGRTIKCPGCPKTFPTIAALSLHVEAGTCPSGMNRPKLDQMVRQHDTEHLITDRLITYHPSDTIQTYATSAAWNGSAYQCYFCPPHRQARQFRTLEALNQHLRSGVHEEKIYKCPGPECGARFVLFSAFVQHVESEKCGVMRFRAAQKVIGDLTTGLQKLLR
ncbi:hypothetical protein JAAARDRAFT_61239 [Jaapia argillacea MUCL 33604]|uniref:C2H2-type domain-containing protein n=1 Tax=Jaapia argillacea MUCL 33604 TaxID=933084 RepID=A0A067PFI4_9AGAM|nr:hypothetical protein JAAARDRAFT_61239 [Jaapia argillacea MUCL 33604]